jgi:predicted transcriptional regulator
MPAARKGPVQIRFEILEYLYYNPGPQPRTHVWRKATTMSYDDFQKHLAYLKERDLVGENEDGDYLITSRGHAIYSELRSVLPSIL